MTTYSWTFVFLAFDVTVAHYTFRNLIVQIVDARHPLLFRCRDLEAYVKEVSKKKRNLLLVNKADFLTEAERCFRCQSSAS